MTGQKGYELVARTLANLGHETIFGLLGSGNFLFTDRFVHEFGGRFVWVRHEASAVAAATAYAQVSGRLGIASVHQGPGVTNTLTTMTHAVRERQPVLLLAGETGRGRPVNQTIDLADVARAAGARVERVIDAADTVGVISRAIAVAERDRCPVIVGLPIDVQQNVADWHEPPPPASANTPRSRPSAQDISLAADVIEGSGRPLILAGRGAALANARGPLEALGDQIGGLFATSLVANGLFAGNPLSLGVCGGFSSDLARRIIPQADLVLAFGATLNQWTTSHGHLIDHRTVLQCDVDPAAIGRNGAVRLGLIGDAAETATALGAELERRGYQGTGFRGTRFEHMIRSYVAADDFTEVRVDGLIDPRAVVVELNQLLPKERTVTYDSGHFHWFPTPYLEVPDAAGFVAAQGFQAVGIALGTAIGAAVARPDRVGLVFMGDGGTLMQLGELDSLTAHGLRVVIAILNDGAYGAEVHHFEPMGFSPEYVQFGDRDLAGVARALGATTASVRSRDDLAGAVNAWLDTASGPLVLDCKVNPAVRSEHLQEAFRQH